VFARVREYVRGMFVVEPNLFGFSLARIRISLFTSMSTGSALMSEILRQTTITGLPYVVYPILVWIFVIIPLEKMN
jgi:hypothetical protein